MGGEGIVIPDTLNQLRYKTGLDLFHNQWAMRLKFDKIHNVFQVLQLRKYVLEPNCGISNNYCKLKRMNCMMNNQHKFETSR